ncbi:MAG: hypothetical protein KAG97_06475, partial [Victivallales bacterium]|nr:hypothetical protein [Victivallales bacterium]
MRSANVVGKFGAFGISALTLCGASANTETLSEDEMQVLKKGNTVYIRNAFSADQDLVRSVALGVHNKQINFLQTFLIPKSAPITAKTKLIHGCGDDACPWNLNGTYIGGNHGCSDGRLATVLNHGLATSDIGSEWEDEAGTKFYILKIVDQNHFVVLSENKGKNEIWRFTKNHRGDFTERKSGRKLKIKKWEMAQLWPSCRIKKQKYLVNGKTPLKEDETVNCGFLDIIEEYDVIRPDSLLESAKDNPGKELNFTAADLDYVTNNKITYRFQPRGACEIRYQAEAGCDFRLGYMGFIQTSPLCQGKYGTHEYYIPKTLPFKAKDRKLDFKNIIDFSGKWDTVNFHVDRGKYLEYPKNLPERFVQFLGDIEKGKKRRKVGYAYGYSLIEGDTKPEIRAKNCSNALFLYRSRKSYP